ncbi:MAG TPA: DNA repair protein RecN, partial [Bacteroidetes bacterium]|nr:DNA repair protein RecN [Bacteroidota bacterium]
MIEKLIIKNYLLIKDAEIDFKKGLNIITGETGAGKTIILDALSLILGERADYSIIKNQDNKLIIEGIFNLKNNSA